MSSIIRWANQVAVGRVLSWAEPGVMLLARVWRRLMVRTTVIGVTGSVGKTTAKDCIAGVLATRGRTFKTYRNQNGGIGVALNVLRIRPWHRFAVIEIGTSGPGQLLPAVRLVQPDIRVILSVRVTHQKSLRTLEETAREKAQFLEALRGGEIAILNADDPFVAPMGEGKACQVRRIGTTPGNDLWAESASSVWPDRLRLRVHRGEEATDVITQLVGTHWTPSILASLAVAVECGITLPAAAAAVSEVEPFDGRMQPVETPSGAVFLRDDYQSSEGTIEPAFRVLRDARVDRRILVISDSSDSVHKRSGDRHKQLGRDAGRTADLIVFVGEGKTRARSAVEAGMAPEAIHMFGTLTETAEFLRSELRRGDLVLLKGRTYDHLARLYFAQLGTVSCWRTDCRKSMLCDICWELGMPASDMRKGVPVPIPPPANSQTEPRPTESAATLH